MGIQKLQAKQKRIEEMTPKANIDTTSSEVYVNVISVTGSGILSSIQQDAQNSEGYIYGAVKIIIDGITVMDESSASLTQYAEIKKYYIINPMFPFRNSLIVQHRVQSSNGPALKSVNTRVHYLLE